MKYILAIYIFLFVACDEDGRPSGHHDIRVEEQTVRIAEKDYPVTVLEAQRLPLSPKAFYAIGVDYRYYQLIFTEKNGCKITTQDFGGRVLQDGWTAVIFDGNITVIEHAPESIEFQESCSALLKQ